MSVGQAERRRTQLGMNHGAAHHRLKKMVMFHLLARHHENTCYRCGEEISSADELSIEHKKPWENISADLFWDMSNIAFSHVRCNCRHNRHVQR